MDVFQNHRNFDEIIINLSLSNWKLMRNKNQLSWNSRKLLFRLKFLKNDRDKNLQFEFNLLYNCLIKKEKGKR